MSRSPRGGHRQRSDRGFTLVEILITIVIIGILSTVTVFAVRGITDRGEAASCETDANTLLQAADMYLGEHQLDEIPATGAIGDADRYERTLVEAGVIREVSELYEVTADGQVTIVSDTCVA